MPSHKSDGNECSEQFREVIRKCNRSHYHEVADVLEYLADHETNQFGSVYRPTEAPHQEQVNAYHIMWAFRAGRAFETGTDR